jgi:hypothetical protein
MITRPFPGTCTSRVTRPDRISQNLPAYPPVSKIRCPAGNLASDAAAASLKVSQIAYIAALAAFGLGTLAAFAAAFAFAAGRRTKTTAEVLPPGWR